MVPDDKIMVGILGTSVSAVGAGLSVTELQAIISIIVTIAGFIISVLIPLGIKLVNKMLNSFTKKLGEDKVNKSEIFTEVKEAIKKFC